MPQETLAAFAAWRNSGVSPSTLTCYSMNLQMLFAGEGGFDSLSGLTLTDVSHARDHPEHCVCPSVVSCDAARRRQSRSVGGPRTRQASSEPAC